MAARTPRPPRPAGNTGSGNTPPAPPNGPGSPRDVPPPRGTFPIDPATLPDPIRKEIEAPDPVAIDTSSKELEDGVNRCPKCGSTEVRQKPGSDLLVCLYCRNEWHSARVEEEFGLGEGIDQLRGTVIASGARDIAADAAAMMTFKCSGCGAEVTVNTANAMTARCHWCRHVLGVNEQIPNGAVPDAVLPFHIKKDDAIARIRQFVDKRRLFALKEFKEQFTPENVVGVYLPYMIVDANVGADVTGKGEVKTREYTKGSGDDKKTYYDADVYQLQRHVDFTVDDLPLRDLDLDLWRRRLAIAGQSAGGGLCAALALMVRDRGEIQLCLQAPLQAMLDDRTGTAGQPVPAADGLVLTAASNRFKWRALLGHPAGASETAAHAVPARASQLAGLPPTFLSIGALDLFTDENLAFAQALARAGVATELPSWVKYEPMMRRPPPRLYMAPEKLRAFAEAQLKDEKDVRIWASQHLNIEIGLALHSERWRGADYWEKAAFAPIADLAELLDRSESATKFVAQASIWHARSLSEPASTIRFVP